MPRYRNYRSYHTQPRSAPSKPSRRTSAKTVAAQPNLQMFLCYALHDIPDNNLLMQVDIRKQANYLPYWLKSGKQNQQVLRNQVCIVNIRASGIVLFPMPQGEHGVDATLAQYGIAYDFTLASSSATTRSTVTVKNNLYVPIAKYQGFAILSQPDHSMKRALVAHNKNDLTEALLQCDQAITNLASLRPDVITTELEKQYNKFEKLRNLYIDQYATHEGQLAAQRALRIGIQCYQTLSA